MIKSHLNTQYKTSKNIHTANHELNVSGRKKKKELISWWWSATKMADLQLMPKALDFDVEDKGEALIELVLE